MKNIRLIYTALLLLLVGSLFAQSDSKADLTVPNYPALNIIGSQTTEITKPGGYSGLEATIISPLVSNDGTIPSDLAVEFQPYFFNSERRTLDDYIKMNKDVDFWRLIGRNSKISIASNDLVASDSSQYSRVGIGYRTLLFEPKIDNVFTDKKYIIDRIQKIERIIDAINSDEKLNPKKVREIYKKDWEHADEILRIALSSEFTKEKKDTMLTDIQDLLNPDEPVVDPTVYNLDMRKGLFIEFAAAASIDFEDRNIYNAAAFQRWGAWFNFTYKLPDKGKSFYLNNISLLTRLSNYSLDPTVVFDNSGTFFDSGLNLQIGLTKRLDLTGEYILRYAVSDFSTQMGEEVTNVASGTIESKLSATLVLHISDNVSTTFSYSLINGEQSYTPENIQMLVLGLTAAILPLK